MPKTKVNFLALNAKFALDNDEMANLTDWLNDKPAGVCLKLRGIKHGEPNIGFEINITTDQLSHSDGILTVELAKNYKLNHKSSYDLASFEKWELAELQVGNDIFDCVGGDGINIENYTRKAFGGKEVADTRYLVQVQL